MPSKNTKSANINYEQAFKKLENIVHQLENDDLPLEKALKAFEEGVNLTHQCQNALTVAEQKVQIILNRNQNNSPSNNETDETTT